MDSPGIIHDRTPDCHPGHVCMVDLTTERSFDSQVTWVIDVLGLFFDILSVGVCTTRYWQTSGGLVQELNVCTVSTEMRCCFLSSSVFFSYFTISNT